MKRAIFLFLAVSVVLPSKAQVSNSPEPTTPAAQVQLGNHYLEQHDYASAMKWFSKAAEQSNAAAENNVGWLYQNGFGVKQDYAQAIDWYRKSADQGNTHAEVNLGWLYENGLGVQRDYVEALKEYLAGANNGDAGAQNHAGVLYEKGLGVSKDYRVAMAWYYRAAEQGNSIAQTNLGLLYRDGLGVPQDYAKAADYFQKAADNNNARAQVLLAWQYANGLGLNRDYEQAMAWYKKAADQGYGDGLSGIGWLYQNGFGVKRDYAEAMNWYKKAAEQNNAEAQNNIGWLYQNGFGVKQDYPEAMSWYQKAAAQGYARAKANIEALSKIGSQIVQTPETTQTDATSATAAASAPRTRVLMAGGIHPPRAVVATDPEYSEEARKLGTTGIALLSVLVGADGLPRDVKVLAPVGNGLDEKALEAVRTWKFEPAMEDGKPVSVQIMVDIEFHLYQKSTIGKVEVVSDTQDASLDSFLYPIIPQASECWQKSTGDTAHTPSAKEGQLTIEMLVERDGTVANAEVVSSSGDIVLDQDARACVSLLKVTNPSPTEFKGDHVVVRMQFLYNQAAMSINPIHAQIAAGNSEQFYLNLAGALSKEANWSVSGIGCKGDECGTITPEGVYRAPDVLPQRPFVVVIGKLPGANPITASAIVTLTAKPATSSAAVE